MGDENLAALEALMNEFFLPSTSNDRKRNIEELLNNFSQQKDAWQYCLMFIKQTSNEYVMMYALSVLETLINKQWHGMTTESKKVIRESIIEHLVKAHSGLPGFIVNKMSKLNVDIARNDWPHFYHDFLTNILQLMQQPETAGLGVILLQTTSEEMANPREDLSISRKQELQQLLLESMPRILSALCNILDGVLERHKLLSATTPPPSPTRQAMIGSPITSSPKTGQSYQNTNIFQSPAYKPASGRSLIPFDKPSQVLCSQALSCIAHLFSWIPLSTMITSHLLNTVFSFAAFGCESSRSITSGSQSLGMLAMCCINELLSKNCVPTDFESFLLQLFQQTFYLLKKLTQADIKTMEALESSFLDKFTEFVRLFVNNHLRRFEANPHFPVLEFLSLLFEYTFKQPTMEEFFSCLNIWQIFVDYIKSKSEERNTKNKSLDRYCDGILGLVRELLKKMQFRHNAEQLEGLDDETVDDDGMTEMQTFISHCNDTLVPIAELVYDQVSSLIDSLFEENLNIYLNMEALLSNTSQQTPEVINRVHCCLKDLCMVLQTSARLVDYCSGARFDEKFAHTEKLAKRLIELAVHNEKIKLYSRQYSLANMKKLVPDFIEIYAHTLASLKAYSHWLAQYYVESYHKPGVREQCAELITTIVNCVTPTISHEVPAKICEWSVNVLSAVLTLVRPVYLYDVHCIQELYKKVSAGYSASFPQKLSQQLLSSLSSYLILRWPALPDSEQKWDMRSSNHASFIASLHPLYLMLKNASPATLTGTSADALQAKNVVMTTLNSLHHLVSSIKEEPKKTKEIMYGSIKEYIELSLHLFSVYISQSAVLEKIVDFFLILVQCLRVQMGVAFTEQTIQTFLDLFTRERIVGILSENNQTGYKVIESFLKMLELIVQEQAAAFRRLLPKIISICMDHIYPLVAPKPSPDIKMPLYELLFELLDNNWKYFYKSSVIKTFGGVNPSEPLEHQQEFVSILHSFGQSFLQPDISIFKHNLGALEKLNQKWKLYHKTIFLDTMMSQFLNVLLQALVVKSHDLLQEDIIAAVYNMASVDFSMFYKTFVPNFLKEVNTIDYHQKQTLSGNLNLDHQDLPSFTQDIQRMVNDLRYYAIVNASLPPGTIDLSQKEPEPISEY